MSSIARPVRFDYLLPRISGRPRPVILDVGCGNHSASITKKYIPGSIYHGLDLDTNYNNDLHDTRCMDKFIGLDLDSSDLREIDPDHYDVIILSHVIEHLHGGLPVLVSLVSKMKPGGIMYVETPHPRSLRFPSMKGTLNFHDDSTHVRVYPTEEIVGALKSHRCEILYAGTRRSLKRIALTPFHCLNSLTRDGFVSGSAFWDLLGFSSVVMARRGARG